MPAETPCQGSEAQEKALRDSFPELGVRVMKNIFAVGFVSLVTMVVGCASQVEPVGEPGSQANPITQDDGRPAPGAPTLNPPSPGAPTLNPPSPGAPTLNPPSPLAPPPIIPGCTPIAAPSGGANPAAAYCSALGYQATGGQCAFPDGTRCEQWAFFRGSCGGQHSFCNLHGGTISNKEENKGTWTASYGLCVLPTGKQCQDDVFAHTCACE